MRRLPLLLLVAALAGALSAPAAQAAEIGAATKLVNRSLKALVKTDGGPPGAIAIIQRKGERRRVIKAGYGNLMPLERPHPNDHMRVASVAKAFSGAVALALVEKGTLSLDDTVGRWLPEQPADWHPVTLRQLLGHTSGLPDFSQNEDFVDAVLRSLWCRCRRRICCRSSRTSRSSSPPEPSTDTRTPTTSWSG